jgi:hypothetical protein
MSERCIWIERPSNRQANFTHAASRQHPRLSFDQTSFGQDADEVTAEA